MAIRVTRAITKNGRYSRHGEILSDPSGFEESLRRMWGWEIVDDPAPVKAPSKAELVQAAHDRGLDPSGLKKAELVALLKE